MSQNLEFNQWEGSGLLTPSLAMLFLPHVDQLYIIPFHFNISFLSLSPPFKIHHMWYLPMAFFLPATLHDFPTSQRGGGVQERSSGDAQINQLVPLRLSQLFPQHAMPSGLVVLTHKRGLKLVTHSLDLHMKILKTLHNSIWSVQCF